MDKNFKIIGGNGPSASIGPFWSWVLGARRLRRHRAGHLEWPEAAHPLQISAPAHLGRVFPRLCGRRAGAGRNRLVNAYLWPPKVAEQYSLANNIAIPAGVEDTNGLAICMAGDKVVRCAEGLSYQTGYPIPVLIATGDRRCS